MSVLPSGTVTFLFTDVEGSTRLLHELGAAAYAEALAEHRRVIREACAAEGGVEVDTQGDAFFFAFPTAPGALGAAAAFTEALASGPVSVRVGLHTGEPLLAAEGYVGKDVHLAARIAASAHGGQVVLSAATAELVGVRGSEPQALSLLELGEHRLKDVEGPVSLFQLGDGRFPPLKTIANTNLPTPASSFLGREHELYEADLLLQDTRLLTVTGPGGAGKTRFALELARRAREERFSDYPAGVFSCFFASLRDPALLLPTIAQTLSIKEQPGQSALDALSSHLEGRQMLLLLDNLEHLLEAAPQLAALLERCGRLTILCTSRELLRLRGERAYALPPLDEQEAVALFCERASVEPSAPIRELSLRLEGLPLALELAAARLAILTPEQLLERLSQRLDLFKGPRDADPRQQTLRATIEWSYDLLAEEERRLFRALSFFAGGCTLEAAERVADAVLDTLQSLVEKSLLRYGDGRYRMLETIREYAAERLEEAGAAENVQRRHADFVLRLSREVAEASGTRPELLSAFAREQDNFRAAFAWLGRSDRSADRLELIGETWPFWADRGSWFEGMGWVESALRHSEAGSALRAKVLLAGAGFAYRLGDLDTVQRYADEGSRLSAQLGDVLVRARSGMFLALVAAERGYGDRAKALLEETIEAAREEGDESLVGIAINNLGDMALRGGDFDEAFDRFEEALALSRGLGNTTAIASDLVNLALSCYGIGRLIEASAAARESLALARDAHAVVPLAAGLTLAAALALDDGKPETATALLGAAAALCEEVDLDLAGFEAEVRENAAQEARRILSLEEYRAAFSGGRAMTLGEAVAYALSSLD